MEILTPSASKENATGSAASCGMVKLVTSSDPMGKLDPAWSPRQAKLYTRAGMGPCQGRVCGPALELLRGWDEPDTVRAPLEPVPLATLASLAAEAASTSREGGLDASS